MKLKEIIILLPFLVAVGTGCMRVLGEPGLSACRIPFPVKYAWDIRFSHDETRLVYALYCSDQAGIWIADRDGHHLRQVQQEKNPDPIPCPTPGPTPALGQWVEPEPVDINAFSHWEDYHHPLWSPDDTKIAYYRGVANMFAIPGMEKLYNCVSTGPDRLCPGSIIYDLSTEEYLSLDMVEGISFSPDSQKVALFRDCRWGGGGGSCRELAPESGTVQLLGDSLGFHVIDLQTRRIVYRDPAVGLDDDRRFTGNAFHWSPDGQLLCYPTEISYLIEEQYHHRPQGKLRIVRLDAPDQKIDLPGLTCAWAPDSRRISYTVYPSARYYTSTQTNLKYAIHLAELHTYDILTKEDYVLFAQEVKEGMLQFGHVEWSPSGKYIAFTFTPLSDEKLLENWQSWGLPKVQTRLIVVDVATKQYWQSKESVASDPLYWMEWSSDSKKIRLLDSSYSPIDKFYLEIAVP